MEIRKIRSVKCKWCGKQFTTYQRAQKFCSYDCRCTSTLEKGRKRYEHREKSSKQWEQPCWTCTKACGDCSWSKRLKPIEGWQAEETTLKTCRADEPNTGTYKILYCPEYEKEIRK